MAIAWLGNEVALCQCFQELAVLGKSPSLKPWKDPGKDFAAAFLKAERIIWCITNTSVYKQSKENYAADFTSAVGMGKLHRCLQSGGKKTNMISSHLH